VCLERGLLISMSTIEELLGRKRSGSGLESREYGRRDPLRWPRGIVYPQKLAPTSPTSGGHSVGIVRSRTQATEFSFLVFSLTLLKSWSVEFAESDIPQFLLPANFIMPYQTVCVWELMNRWTDVHKVPSNISVSVIIRQQWRTQFTCVPLL
jgi:hypothetical protein